MRRRRVKLENGAVNFAANPIIEIVPGPKPYLWIGNDADGDKRCLGTVEGAALLRLAEAITEAMRGAR